jgi:hypothetical protein
MTSILKVDTIQDTAGNNIINESSDTITIGASGDTITIPSGATLTLPDASIVPSNISTNNAQLRFIASTTSATTLTTQNVFYKTTWNEQLIDNFNEFDPTTNYRFTASEAGTYIFQTSQSFALDSDQDVAYMSYYKNGSTSSSNNVYIQIMASGTARTYLTTQYKLILSVNDYIEIYAKWVSAGTNRVYNSNATTGEATWWGWKIG